MIAEIAPYNNYTGNGSTTQFDFDFYIEDSTQLIVQHTSSEGVITTLTNGTDYSIHETGNPNGSYITFPISGSSYSKLQSNEVLSLILTLPIAQESEYGTSSELDLRSLEYSLDYLTRICQIMNRQVIRAAKIPEGAGVADITFPMPEANKVIQWDEEGQKLINYDVDGKVNNILNIANSADTKATNALSTANTASTNASNAVSTANSAASNASAALSNSTTAVSTANNASTNASNALSKATQASNKVDSFGEDIATVISAAEKINELEEAVTTATNAAASADAALEEIERIAVSEHERIQFAPFSINNGAVTDGENVTLTYSGNVISCAPCTITTADNKTYKDTQTRTLEAPNTTGTAYIVKSVTNGSLGVLWNMTFSKTEPNNPSNYMAWVDISKYPAALKYYATSSWTNNNSLVYIGTVTLSSGTITAITNRKFNDSGYTIAAFDADVNFSNITQTAYDKFQAPLVSGTNIKTVNSNSLLGAENITLANPALSNLDTAGYAKLQYAPFAINTGSVNASGENNTLTYSGNVISCAPCTITTADGRTFTDSETRTRDVSAWGNVPYVVFKSCENNSISTNLTSRFSISKVAPSSPSEGAYWLDISTIPAKFKVYDGTSWNVNNNLVWIGSFTRSNNSITSLTNRKFNDSGYLLETYGADYTLSNLNTSGYAKLQYMPFAINSGSVNASGENNTLTYSGTTVTCAPCIYTSASGITYHDTETRTWTAPINNGTAYVIKNPNGLLGTFYGFYAQKSAPSNPGNYRLWVDTSKVPAVTKYYVDGTWLNTNGVILGKVTLSNGAITELENRKFNDSGYLTQRYVTESIYPDYSAAYALSGISTTSTSFNAPNDGYVSAHLSTYNSGTIFYIDDRPIGFMNANGSFDCWTAPFLVKKGSHTFKVNGNVNLVLAVEFYPMKGVI